MTYVWTIFLAYLILKQCSFFGNQKQIAFQVSAKKSINQKCHSKTWCFQYVAYLSMYFDWFQYLNEWHKSVNMYWHYAFIERILTTKHGVIHRSQMYYVCTLWNVTNFIPRLKAPHSTTCIHCMVMVVVCT